MKKLMKRTAINVIVFLLSMLMPTILGAKTIITTGYPIVRTSTDGTTLTFLFVNSQRDASTGIQIEDSYTTAPNWCNTKVKKVVFDASFASYSPQSTAYWLSGCSNLTTIEGLEYLVAEEISSADNMFENCSNLTFIDLSSFNAEKLLSCKNMFLNCSKLASIYGTSWNITDNMTETEKKKFVIYQTKQSVPYMFNGCTKLLGGSGTQYSASVINDYSYCHIDGGTTDPGYFTMKGTATLGAYGVEYKGTLTLYYDKQKNVRPGKKYDIVQGEAPGWNGRTTITKAIIDGSMINYSWSSTTKLFSNCYELKSIEGLGNLNMNVVTDMSEMFYNCCSLESIEMSFTNTTNVTNLSQLFYHCFSLNNVTLKLNTSNVTNMSEMFCGCFNLKTLDLSSFTTAKVKTMKGMFYDCRKLNALNISSFNTTNVIDMSQMMANCYSLVNISLLHFITDNVTNMSNMFGDLNPITVSKPAPKWQSYFKTIWDKSEVPSTSTTNSIDITNFNTANVTDMSGMFMGCENLKSLELRNFNTVKVTNMSSMFSSCTQLTTLNIGTFKTDNVTSFADMFLGCKALADVDLSSFSTSNARSLNGMFKNCRSLKSLYLTGFSNGQVTDMSSMFNGCSALTTIYVQDTWSTNAVTVSSDMFTGCTSLIGGNGTRYDSGKTDKEYACIDGSGHVGYLTALVSSIPSGKQAYAVINGKTMTFYYDNKANSRTGLKYPVISNSSMSNIPTWIRDYKHQLVEKVVFDASFSTYRPTSTAYWFYCFAKLTSIEGIANLNTSAVTNMAEMFRYCYVLQSLDLSTFDTSHVTNMSCMFCYCWALTSINLSSFNTSKVTTMTHLFHQCPISSIDVGTFDTQNVTDMSIMFAECKNLKTLNLKNFKTDKVTNMSCMFIYDSSLTTIFASDKWSTASVNMGHNMFTGDNILVGGMGTKYDGIHFDQEYALIDEGIVNPGYLTGMTPYAVYDNESTLTFYFDDLKDSHSGRIYSYSEFPTIDEKGNLVTTGWQELRNETTADIYEIKKVNFDNSFANFHGLRSTAGWFSGFVSLNEIVGLNNLNTENVSNMNRMFFRCTNLSQIDLKNFDTRNVVDMHSMFYDCSSVESLDLSKFNTAKVIDMSYMFVRCKALTELDVSSFNTQNVIDMSYMFGELSLNKLNLSNFSVNHVSNFEGQFWYSRSLTDLDLSNFYTDKATNMSGMFRGCSALTYLNIDNFNTSEVTEMHGMFSECRKLNTINIASFNTKNVIKMEYMFDSCDELTTIYVGDGWSTNSLKSDEGLYMFLGDYKLIGGKGTKYKAKQYDYSYAHIDGGTSDPGYLTYNDGTIKKGDANYDGKVDIHDISAMANLITQDKYNDRADMNNDSKVNAADLVILINEIKLAQ